MHNALALVAAPGILGESMPEDSTRSPQRKSLLVQIGEKAMRDALLEALIQNGWNLTKAAVALQLSGPSAVIKAIQSLGLMSEYEQAKADGAVRPGRRQS